MNAKRRTARAIRDLTDAAIESTNPVHEIIGAIDEVVDKTNLLALSAATESSRGNDPTNYLADVAEAIRHMAERAVRATEEINALVEEVQSEECQDVTGGRGPLLAQRADLALSDVKQASEAVLERLRQAALAPLSEAGDLERIARA
jgi:methyl-accepting chemotaxis protein